MDEDDKFSTFVDERVDYQHSKYSHSKIQRRHGCDVWHHISFKNVCPRVTKRNKTYSNAIILHDKFHSLLYYQFHGWTNGILVIFISLTINKSLFDLKGTHGLIASSMTLRERRHLLISPQTFLALSSNWYLDLSLF